MKLPNFYSFLTLFGKFSLFSVQINKMGVALYAEAERGLCIHEHKKYLKGQVAFHSVLCHKNFSNESLLKYSISSVRVTQLFNSLMYPLDVTVTAQ